MKNYSRNSSRIGDRRDLGVEICYGKKKRARGVCFIHHRNNLRHRHRVEL